MALCDSIEHAKTLDVEAVVVYGGGSQFDFSASAIPLLRVVNGRTNCCKNLFNKCALLNTGVHESRGNLLTFLDADAMVCPNFVKNMAEHDWKFGEKACHTVRYLPATDRPEVLDALEHDETTLAEIFRMEQLMQKGPMARGKPHVFHRVCGTTIFGNSQFTITRETLGDCRWDERFSGGKLEDADMNLRIADALGTQYKPFIPADGEASIICFRHPHIKPWITQEQTHLNNRLMLRRYCRYAKQHGISA